MGFLSKAKEKWDAMVGAGDRSDPPPERMQMPKRRLDDNDDSPSDPS